MSDRKSKKPVTEFGLVPVRQPCVECPFRRTSIRAWLGSRDITPVDYVLTALSDNDVGCHLSPGYPTGDKAMIRSCAGLAIFRRNICKQPRGGTARNAVAIVQPNCTLVFKLPQEFIDHHTVKKSTPMNEDERAAGYQRVLDVEGSDWRKKS